MANRSEVERAIVMESGSPLQGHSLNQDNIKSHIEGYRRLSSRVGKKVISAQERHLRRLSELDEQRKVRVVLNTTRALKSSEYRLEDAEAELKYLSRRGMNIKDLLMTTGE